MPNFPFPVDPVLTGIVVAYRNASYIADAVLPRLDPQLTRQEFRYLEFPFGEAITVPNTKVGRKGEPDTVEFTGIERQGATDDYGLDDVVPIDDINNAPAGYSPLNHAAQRVMDLVLLDREIRVANKVFNAATYSATNKVTLSGTSQWSDAASTPIIDVAEAADAMIMRPNIGVIGRAGWTALRTNQSILKAISVSGTDQGMATKRAVADLFELEDIVIGEGWVNSAKPGQAVTRVRAWGKHFALMRREPLATSQGGLPTFGWTAQYGGKVSGQMAEPKVGLRGAIRVRSGESVKEVISAPDLGYFFQNIAA